MDSYVLRVGLQVKKDAPVPLVSPQNPNPVETIYLSNIDQQLAFPVETLFFFKENKDANNKTLDIADTVKKAFSEKLLVPYYFLAGRINFNLLQQRLELVCNNAGILFVGASSDLRLDELGDLSAPNPSFRDLIFELEGFHSLADTPVFTAQVAFFIVTLLMLCLFVALLFYFLISFIVVAGTIISYLPFRRRLCCSVCVIKEEPFFFSFCKFVA